MLPVPSPLDYKKALEFAKKIKGNEESQHIFMTLAREFLKELPEGTLNIFEVKQVFEQLMRGSEVGGAKPIAIVFTVQVLAKAAKHCEEE